MRRFFSVLFCLTVCAVLACGCGGSAGGGTSIRRKAYKSEELQFTAPAEDAVIAVFDTSAGEIRAVLYPDHAPQAVENFTALAESGFYGETKFYRAEYGFCVSGGLDENGGSTTKWGGSDYPAETTDALHHYSGALCAAMNADGEGGSVFYFMQTLPQAPADELVQAMTNAGYRQEVIDAYSAVGGAPYLDYTDTVFGQVYEGMEVIDAIAEAAQTAESADAEAAEPVILHSVTVTTYPAD